MQDLSLPTERQKQPRYVIDLPLNFKMTESPDIYAGLIIDASKEGLQIQAMKENRLKFKHLLRNKSNAADTSPQGNA
jgi:hypothetical protein